MRNPPHDISQANRCACCGGKFGLVRHYSWRTAFCSRTCRERFRARDEGGFRWLRRLQTAYTAEPVTSRT